MQYTQTRRKFQKPWLLALSLLLSSSLFYVASFERISVADDLADTYFSETIQSATIAYATTRGVNAVVSVIKESELDLAPAGVGVTIAAGQILDPIDDMTERLSSVLVAAITSLGIQKIGFEISALVSFKAIAFILLLCIPMFWFKTEVTRSLLELGLKTCFALLLLRFMLPVSALVSASITTHWLTPSMEVSLDKLSVVSQSYDDMAKLPAQQSEGFFSSLTDTASEKISQTQEAFTHMVNNVEVIIDSLLSLMTAYVAIFVVQIIVLPLLMLWLLSGLFRSNALDALTHQISNFLTANHQPQK